MEKIANMDEIPLFINILSKKTIAEIGYNEVIIKIYGQMRVHVTVILWYFSDGTKLLPMLVFKGISGEGTENKKNSLVKDRKILVYCQTKTCSNGYIMRVWILEFCKKYCYFKI